jgi:hypothetical protein
MTQKTEIDKNYLLATFTGHGNDHYADLLNRLPTLAVDDLDRFILSFLNILLDNNRGSGFLAIQAKQKINAMKMMSYDELRTIAQLSPDYQNFVMTNKEINSKTKLFEPNDQVTLLHYVIWYVNAEGNNKYNHGSIYNTQMDSPEKIRDTILKNQSELINQKWFSIEVTTPQIYQGFGKLTGGKNVMIMDREIPYDEISYDSTQQIT